MAAISKFSDSEHLWALEVGRGMMAFGNMEWLILHALQFIPKEPLNKTGLKLQFNRRVELLQEILEAREGAHAENLRGQLAKLAPLAVLRNLVAHEPLVLQVFQDSEGKHKSRTVIGSANRENKRVDFQRLSAWRAECEKTADDLAEAVWDYILPQQGFTTEAVWDKSD